MLSIIIPSRSSEYTQQTIDDLLSKAEGEIEIIVILDGYWPEPMIKNDSRVIILHSGTKHNNRGMRAAINMGMSIAKGKYVMKIDEHCMVDQGYDVKLIQDCENNWVIIPRRYRLDPDEWKIIEDRRPPIDYMHIDFPFQRPNDTTCGLHGAEWSKRAKDRKDILIDETPSMQGSCYFMHKSHWDKVIKRMEEEKYGPFTQEAQEIGFKTWFTGGKVMVNKKTWYAHMHKGKRGKNYQFSNTQYEVHQAKMEQGRIFCRDYWLDTKDYPLDWSYFMSLFPDMPGWGVDWKSDIAEARLLEIGGKS